SAGDRLHAVAHGRRAARCRVRSRSLHHLSRPGDVVHDRTTRDRRGSRGGAEIDGREVRHQGGSRSRARGWRRTDHLSPRQNPRGGRQAAMRMAGWLMLLAVSVVALEASALRAQNPKVHDLPLAPSTVHWGYYDSRLTPALRVASGDRVRIETMVAGGLQRLRLAGASEAEIPD